MNEDHLVLWDYANIQLMDIRHKWLHAGDKPVSYRFPASGYLCIVRGGAGIRLDSREYTAERFHIIHSGKGARLDIRPVHEELEYYLVLYKASLSGTAAAGIRRRYESGSPFQRQYAFAPDDPAQLLLQLQELRRLWLDPEALQRIQGKSRLYQFIYEVEKQLQRAAGSQDKEDLVTQAIRYINEFYHEPVSLSSVAGRLNYSVSYLAKQFKSRTGSSLIDYLIRVRVDKACRLLRQTDLSLQEVAASVGYPDLSYFIRIFKKTAGETPGQFRAGAASLAAGADCPTDKLRLSDAEGKREGYIGGVLENHYQYKRGDDLPMYRNTRLTLGAVMLLCLSIMLSACTPAAGNVNLVPDRAVEATAAAQTAGQESSVRSFTDSQGHEVSIPVQPRRVILQGNSIGDLLALGIEPVGVDRRFIEGSAYSEYEQTPAEDIGFPTNLEKLLALEPDLTLLGYVLDKEYDEIAKISPAVVFDQSKPLSERLPVIGEIVGKQAEAEQLLADYQAKAEVMWDELHKQGNLTEGETAVILIYYWDKTMYLMKSGGVSNLVYQPKGYKMSEQVKEIEAAPGTPFIEVSPELMHQMLIGDRLFVIFPENPDAEESFNELLNTALWQKLPSVQNGKVTFIESKWNYDDMLTSNLLLDQFPKLLGK
ncbi:AraC family transcriptional regulator [Paenibacillus sp. MMS20-IR301]|uniref:AraC family transcriptional regulator n=1 Tax=Paenibacillus sp. MMS20-IR301 TaxID=2895946 RepID=UPI0028E64BE4|nr:AraC family transcriptional regulator [Paenibacillus sp. MMS20-IR301]WNS45587.1 AraC family transcriptional regulator [Paenibacillus sp. MMS20-IR301]